MTGLGEGTHCSLDREGPTSSELKLQRPLRAMDGTTRLGGVAAWSTCERVAEREEGRLSCLAPSGWRVGEEKGLRLEQSSGQRWEAPAAAEDGPNGGVQCVLGLEILFIWLL